MKLFDISDDDFGINRYGEVFFKGASSFACNALNVSDLRSKLGHEPSDEEMERAYAEAVRVASTPDQYTAYLRHRAASRANLTLAHGIYTSQRKRKGSCRHFLSFDLSGGIREAAFWRRVRRFVNEFYGSSYNLLINNDSLTKCIDIDVTPIILRSLAARRSTDRSTDSESRLWLDLYEEDQIRRDIENFDKRLDKRGYEMKLF